HYALRQARYVDVDVEPYAVNRLCLSMRNVRDYDPPKDYHRVATIIQFSYRQPHLGLRNRSELGFAHACACVESLSRAQNALRYVDVDVEPYAVNRLCLSMRNVRDYDPPKDYHRVATIIQFSSHKPL